MVEKDCPHSTLFLLPQFGHFNPKIWVITQSLWCSADSYNHHFFIAPYYSASSLIIVKENMNIWWPSGCRSWRIPSPCARPSSHQKISLSPNVYCPLTSWNKSNSNSIYGRSWELNWRLKTFKPIHSKWKIDFWDVSTFLRLRHLCNKHFEPTVPLSSSETTMARYKLTT